MYIFLDKKTIHESMALLSAKTTMNIAIGLGS
jgi:hypothetical protein